MRPDSCNVQFLFDDPTAYHLIPASELRNVPWKNGGGSTKELMLSPANASIDDFCWRISIAEVKTEGPFSIFPDIQRNITLLKGESMVLNNNITKQTHRLSPLNPYDFNGEDEITATLPHGETEDFNVMVRRSSGLQAEVLLVKSSTQISIGHVSQLLYCAVGPCMLGGDTPENTLLLNTGDSIYFPKSTVTHNDKRSTLTLGSGQCLHVTLSSPT